MQKNNNDRQKLVITLGLKFEEMAAHCNVIAQRLTEIKEALQQLADSANREELKGMIECGELSLNIGPISMADMETSENQLSGPKMWMPLTINLPGHPGDGPQTIGQLEAYLIEKFGWQDGANYMTVDSASKIDGMSQVWQWSMIPLKIGYAEAWVKFGPTSVSTAIGLISLPENIDWKDCLFTRTTGTNE